MVRKNFAGAYLRKKAGKAASGREPAMMVEKNRIRDEYLARRARIPGALRHAKSAKIVEQLSKSSLFQSHERVLCYAALPEEADLTGIRTQCTKMGKRIAFPKVCGDEILFFETLPQDILTEGSFHVPEPDAAGKSPVLWEDALCLTPGIVFDRNGNRFGYGRGFYDRYFAAYPHLTRCGIAFAEQISKLPLPIEDTDLPVHFLLTEDGFLL